MASVRGIGVAVMTSTSGFGPFGPQGRALHDSKAVLLVDDDQAQFPEFHPLLDEGVGAHDEMDLTRFRSGGQLPFSPRDACSPEAVPP